MKPGRNDLCACGSGRKYKLCHGAVALVLTQQRDATQASEAAPRTCGGCTACCDGWVAGTIRGHEMKRGVPCHFRGDHCCSIYAERPVEPCRNFVCGWLAPGSPFPDECRPDRLGVMIVPTRWRGALAYILVNAGRDPDDALIGWMREWSRATRTPFFYEQAGEKLGFGPPEFQHEMLDKASKGERMW